MFIDGNTFRATCSNCRLNNKMRKKQSRDLSQLENINVENDLFEKQLIEFEELTDELLFEMDRCTSSCDKENLSTEHSVSFKFKRAINFDLLFEDPKIIAETIIEAVQNADEYKWKYV